MFLIVVLVVIVITIALNYHSAIVTIDEEIPENVDVKSSQALIRLAKHYMDNYWPNREYYVGKMNISLGSDLLGEVNITFVDDYDGVIPNMAYMTLDTRNRKVVEIRRLTRDHKLYPGKTNFEQWKIDIDEALKISKKVLSFEKLHNYAPIFISGNKDYLNGEVWYISFGASFEENEYLRIMIDVYSGEVKCIT